jgi:hypothetical protein
MIENFFNFPLFIFSLYLVHLSIFLPISQLISEKSLISLISDPIIHDYLVQLPVISMLTAAYFQWNTSSYYEATIVKLLVLLLIDEDFIDFMKKVMILMLFLIISFVWIKKAWDAASSIALLQKWKFFQVWFLIFYYFLHW